MERYAICYLVFEDRYLTGYLLIIIYEISYLLFGDGYTISGPQYKYQVNKLLTLKNYIIHIQEVIGRRIGHQAYLYLILTPFTFHLGRIYAISWLLCDLN